LPSINLRRVIGLENKHQGCMLSLAAGSSIPGAFGQMTPS
jgi:hypothetical protein